MIERGTHCLQGWRSPRTSARKSPGSCWPPPPHCSCPSGGEEIRDWFSFTSLPGGGLAPPQYSRAACYHPYKSSLAVRGKFKSRTLPHSNQVRKINMTFRRKWILTFFSYFQIVTQLWRPENKTVIGSKSRSPEKKRSYVI